MLGDGRHRRSTTCGAALDGVLPRPRAGRARRRRRHRARPPTRCSRWPPQRGVDPAELRGIARRRPDRAAGPHRRRRRPRRARRAGRAGARRAGLRVATVDGTVYHDAGASDATRLGIATAVGVAYLRALDRRRAVESTTALAALEFRFAVTAEQFPSIAKLRAARRVWDRVAELCGGVRRAGRGQRQHAVTSRGDDDPARPVGEHAAHDDRAASPPRSAGPTRSPCCPSTPRSALPDDFARRIARNTHGVLHDESSLGAGARRRRRVVVRRVADRRAGRGGLGRCSPTIERDGGALAALDDGTIAPSCSRRTRAARRRHRPPPRADHRRQRVRAARRGAGRPRRRPRRRPSGGLLPRAALRRGLRGAARPQPTPRRRVRRVFLAALGPFAAHSARVGFATNLFQAGGLDVRRRHRRPDEIVEAFADERDAGRLPLLVATRSTPTRRPPAAAALRERRRRRWSGWPGKADVPTASTATSTPAATRWTSCAATLDTSGSAADEHDPRLRRRRRSAHAGATPPRPTTRVDVARRGRRPRASPSRRSTPRPTSPASTSSTPTRASRRSCAGRTRRCTSTSRGRSGSTPASRPRPSPTPSTAATWRWGRRACRSPSTCPRTAATTATTRGWSATSAWPASPSTRSTTCASSSTASRWTRCPCR